jgi:hypothetical protein
MSHAPWPTIERLVVRLRHAWLGPALIAFASMGSAQTPAPNAAPQAPDFTVQVWGQVAVDFSTRVSSYFELRSRLEKELPPVTVTDDPIQIRNAERALARKVRAARHGAKQGEIFTPSVSVEFKRALLREINRDTRELLMDDNPGAFSHKINGTYPHRKPLSTVPLNVLEALPRLPEDIEYRFLGRHLILHDTRSNLILDRIPCAVPGHARVECYRGTP